MASIDPDLIPVLEAIEARLDALEAVGSSAPTDAAGYRFFARLHTLLAETPIEQHAAIYNSLLNVTEEPVVEEPVAEEPVAEDPPPAPPVVGGAALTPSDSIMDAISAKGGPGGEIRLSAGTYNQQIHLRYSDPSHNGTHGNPLRIILDPGAVLRPPGQDGDTIRIDSAKYVTIEGEGTIVGASNFCDGTIHMFGNSSRNRSPTGIAVKGLTITRNGGGRDGIKHSEGIGCTVEDVLIDSANGNTRESLIDCNKGTQFTGKNITFRGACQHGLVFKGGFVGAEVDGVYGSVNGKGMEIGGYQGTGYWGRLLEAIESNGANLDMSDPYEEELMSKLRFYDVDALQWAAREIYIRDFGLSSSSYGYRFIGGWDSRIDLGNVFSENGDINDSTRYTSNRNGAFYCSNIWIDGVQTFAPRPGYTLPR